MCGLIFSNGLRSGDRSPVFNLLQGYDDCTLLATDSSIYQTINNPLLYIRIRIEKENKNYDNLKYFPIV